MLQFSRFNNNNNDDDNSTLHQIIQWNVKMMSLLNLQFYN